MSKLGPRGQQLLKASAVYIAVIIAVLAFSVVRARLMANKRADVTEPPVYTSQPFFSLTTNRTFSSAERAKLSVSYRSVDHLDFRVYQVKDPLKFFKQLEEPHKMGENEKEQLSNNYRSRLALLERTHSLKSLLYSSIKDYVRRQLQRDHREVFNQKFRQSGGPSRTPLNIADYARVPLLNSNQLVSAWRERLPTSSEEYDQQIVSLGTNKPGVYLVEAVNENLRAYSIAVVTDLTMVQKSTRDGQVVVYAVDRKSGVPHANVNVEIARGKESLTTGVTDKSGIFKTEITKPKTEANATPPEDQDPEGKQPNTAYLVLAHERDNFAISDLDSFYFGSEGDEEGGSYDSNAVSYVYTDRPIYRPAQKVYFKGILRRWGRNGYELPDSKTVNVTIEDPNSGKISEHELPLTSRGTFSGEVDIADEAPLGSYSIVAKAGSTQVNSSFEVQEYKKPEFKVKVTGPKQFAAVGEKVKFSVQADYFFGAPVTKADVHYNIYQSRYYHSWWNSDGSDDFDDAAGADNEGGDESQDNYYGNEVVKEGDGTLDSQGRLSVDFEVPEPGEDDEWDYQYRFEAQVTDQSRREMQGSAAFVGTRGKTIADAEAERYLYYQNETAKVLVRTADYEGHPVPQKVTLKFIEQHWERIPKVEEYNGYKYTSYDYVSHEQELPGGEVTTDSQGKATYDFNVPVLGYIHIKTIINENGREVVNRGGYIWATDKKSQWSDFSFRDTGEKTIKLVPDKKSYRPGETAHVLALLPSDQAHLLITTELSTVMTARLLDAPGRSVVIDVPIERRFAPNVYLNVTYVKDDDMIAETQLLAVPARDRMLKLDVIPNKKEYKPRDVASYTVLARNEDGSPASGAEISLGVVDEAIYSIQPETAGNIKREFYGRRYNEVQTSLSIRYTFTGYSGNQPIDLALNKKAYQLADFKSESPLAEPTIRKEFKDTAFWQSDLVTGADGKATVQFKLPDNLTTWRATARAVTADTRVGSTVQKVISRKDVIMRLEMPRFLTEGDTVTISGVVHNFLPADKSTKISLELNGAQLLGESTQTVTIAKNGEHRVDWRVQAQQPGQLRLLAKALTDTESDAVEMTMEIVPHGLKQTMGGAVSLTQNDGEQTQTFNLPMHPDIQARSLRIEASSSIAGTLFGALDYLTSFPYGCTEQTMSSFLPDVIVAQTLKDVPAARIRDTNDLPKKVQRGLDRLYSYQHDDGGWGWWKDDSTDPFMSAYVVDGLALAGRNGFQIEQWRLDRGREKLSAMLDANKRDNGNPIDQETRAYMIYALVESGTTDNKYLEQLYSERGQLQPYGRALLALALKQRGDNRAAEIAGQIESSAHVNEYDADWQTHRVNDYGRDVMLDVETTALSLKALSQISPRSALLPKAARWLVGHRRNGYYWVSTKETAFAIYGLTDYVKASQELSPDYTFEVYVNGTQVASQHVTSTANPPLLVVKKGTEVGSNNQIRIVKHGRGALYVTSALEYFTGEDEVQAQSTPDLKLTREYLRLRVSEDSNGKSSWKIEPLNGELHSGDLIVVRLHLEGARAQYLMIEDPIPAGCEQVGHVNNLALSYADNHWTDWYSQREFRDNRTVIFKDYFDGKATFQYAMRVEVPGEFRVAPARAELMYQPTVQANTGNGRLKILDKK
ncbi:MAG: alpha-2-macroglobulin-like protein [Acidobacteria bacterium]|nr:alpha-2-macroglobulin-like protein [Acidobacteriota bacterium]